VDRLGLQIPVVVAAVERSFVLADDDGVVVVPRAEIDEVLRRAKEREQREDVTRKRIGWGTYGGHI